MQVICKTKRPRGASSPTPAGRLWQVAAATAFLLAGLFAGVPLTFADTPAEDFTCMDDKWHRTGLNSQHLTCTAKEVFIEEDAEGNKIIDATVVNSDDCAFPGDTATVDIVSDIHFNADRFDIGIYSALDGGDAKNGTCAVDVLSPDADPPGKDADGDSCGDVDVPGGGGTFTDFNFQTLTLTCEDQDRDGFLDFGVCFSWRTKGSNDVCNGEADIFPGSPSKCFCERVNIDVLVPPAEPTIEKTADPTEVPEPGDNVTFTVEVTNPSLFASLTLDSLVDNIYGDLNGEGDCSVPQPITSGGTYTCSFTAFVAGNGGDSEIDTATASGQDENLFFFTISDDAKVDITDVLPNITLDKTANPTEVLEPGADVSFTVVVTNTSVSSDPVTIDVLTDDVHGDLHGQGDCFVPQTLAGDGGTYSCSFTAFVEGNAGESELDKATASGADDDGNPVSASDTALVDINDVPSMIVLDKTADPTFVDEPGADVVFTFVVNNTSTVDTVTIDSLVDDIYGDLHSQGNCSVPQEIAAGGSYSCSATFLVEGNGGDVVTNVATASGTDDDGVAVSDDDDATVNVNNVAPTAAVVKIAKQAIVTYQVTVSNTSNDADPLTLTHLDDDVYGNLLAPNANITGNTCEALLNLLIQPDDSVSCSFDAEISADEFGEASVTDTVTGQLEDDETPPTAVIPDPSDTATVTLGN